MSETTLDGAVKERAPLDFKKTILDDRIGRGGHGGYFIGLGDVHKSETNCKGCNGSGKFKEDAHRICKGTGRVPEEKVAILYQMAADLVQEEWVNYSLAPSGQLRDGRVKSATTLYRRMRVFAGGQIEDVDGLKAWYRSWVDAGKQRIRIDMYVSDNDARTALVIKDVTLHVSRPRVEVDPSFLSD